MAAKGLRIAARLLDWLFEAMLVVGVLLVAGDSRRVWTSMFLVVATIACYEAVGTVAFGGSIGKRISGLRVVALDRVERPRFAAALQRGAIAGILTVLPPFLLLASLASVVVEDIEAWERWLLWATFTGAGLGLWTAWATSALGDPLGRGFADRLADTMVVPRRFVGVVTTRELPGYADAVRRPRMGPLGRIADLDVRAKARMRRLVDRPVLAGAIGLLALAVSLPFTTGWVILASSAAWVVLFVVDETRLVARTGATPGHALAGLVIRDRRRGGAPGIGRSLARATVLGLTLYVPPLWPLLGVSMLMIRTGEQGRGLHDLAGGTVVVADPSLDPETQRQRAMRMRLGRAG